MVIRGLKLLKKGLRNAKDGERTLKYMGSKSRIAKDIVPIIQKCIDNNNISTYIEPFVGGCNIIDKVQCQFRYGSDTNEYLIALFNHLQNGGKLLPKVTRELYSEVRTNYKNGDYDNWYVGNIGFLASYNGRWFDGGYARAGYEKTKTGERYRDYYREAKDNIEKQMHNLTDVVFSVKDYREIIPLNVSMIYCDPPYKNTKQFANAIHFNYEEFWNKVREWSKDNYVLVSELYAPNDFICIFEKTVSRSIQSRNKSKATEKLFTWNNGKFFMKYLNTKEVRFERIDEYEHSITF